MNFQQLKYIVKIADCHSITKAAQELYVSQPYLSKVISDFEAKVKKQIFIRHSNGLELTNYGQKVYLLAQSILRQIEMLDNLEKEENPETESVKLSFSVGNLILKESLLLDYFATSHSSKNDVAFYETTIGDCIQNVEKGICEFSILVIHDFQKKLLLNWCARKGLEYIELDEGYPYYHLHRNHSLANQDEIEIDSLIQFPFVRLKTDEFTKYSHEKFLNEYPDIYVHRCITVNHYHTYLSLVKNNGAFMVGNKWQISELEKMGIRSIRFSSLKYKVHLALIKKEVLPFSAEAKRFLYLFREKYGL